MDEYFSFAPPLLLPMADAASLSRHSLTTEELGLLLAEADFAEEDDDISMEGLGNDGVEEGVSTGI